LPERSPIGKNRGMSERHGGPFGVHGHLGYGKTAKYLVQHHQFSSHVTPLHFDKATQKFLELLPLPSGLSLTLLTRAIPQIKAADASAYVGPLNVACEKYDITRSVRRMAAFLGHIAKESAYLHKPEEALYYKDAHRINKFFGAIKTDQEAQAYIGNPEALANKVYANQDGNGDVASGDGWKYRGRGLIHLTHKNQYVAFKKAAGVDCVNNPDLLKTPQYAALSAAWFWNEKRLNALADAENYRALSLRINTKLDSFPEREANRKRALDAFFRASLTNLVSLGLGRPWGL
jgi:putative chitinase